MTHKFDGNFQAADAYHAELAEREAARERLLKECPPRCTACELAEVSPDGKWCWCATLEKWVGGELKCLDGDFFEPTRNWDGNQ